MVKNKILALLIFSGFFSACFFAFQAKSNPADNFCLSKSYNIYKKLFMSKDGRIIDYERNNVTTSEGQSYMMLQSLEMGDKETFDIVFTWSKNNIQREDKLFSWLWGKHENGEYKIIDENSASDADIDIAFALLLAYEKWGKYEYLQEAQHIINGIWNKETKKIGNYLVLMPGVKQTEEEKIEINPSYFSPYAFRLFQKYDELHDWNLLVDSSYYYLNKVCFKTKTQLPPNWFIIKDNEIILEDSEKSDFSYDAIRVFARIYVDYIFTKDPRALAVLEKSNIFIQEWGKSKTFLTNYKQNGELRNNDNFIGGKTMLIPVLSIIDEKTAAQMFKEEVEPSIKNKNFWQNKKDYYGKNLTWLGLYLYENQIKGCDLNNE